jgi:hypothetical protein
VLLPVRRHKFKTIADRYVLVEGKDLNESTVLKGIQGGCEAIRWNHLRQYGRTGKLGVTSFLTLAWPNSGKIGVMNANPNRIGNQPIR